VYDIQKTQQHLDKQAFSVLEQVFQDKNNIYKRNKNMFDYKYEDKNK
jgi:hypothetical protein